MGLISRCGQTEMLEDSYEGRLHFVKSHGLLVVLEILEVSRRSREILAVLLRIINLVRLRHLPFISRILTGATVSQRLLETIRSRWKRFWQVPQY
jgi:hypothetical protein